MSESHCRVISAAGGGLLDALAGLQRDDGVRVAILSEFAGGPPVNREGGEASPPSTDLVSLIESLGKPVIAAVGGPAAGEGCLLALACAFAVATSAAGFALPPDYADRDFALALVKRVVGEPHQHSPLLLRLTAGEAITAHEALSIGLVTQVVAGDAELHEVCQGLARQIGEHAPLALKFAAEAVNGGLRRPLEGALRRESELFSRCLSTADAREGVRAFYEKRPPRFTGR
jgi:enoyl-CoA hydratase